MTYLLYTYIYIYIYIYSTICYIMFPFPKGGGGREDQIPKRADAPPRRGKFPCQGRLAMPQVVWHPSLCCPRDKHVLTKDFADARTQPLGLSAEEQTPFENVETSLGFGPQIVPQPPRTLCRLGAAAARRTGRQRARAARIYVLRVSLCVS